MDRPRPRLHTIIDVIQTSMRIIGVVNHHRASQAITVLRRQVAMVPEGP